MGREYEEGLIRTHQQEAPKKKGEAAPICWTTILTAESLLEELKVW